MASGPMPARVAASTSDTSWAAQFHADLADAPISGSDGVPELKAAGMISAAAVQAAALMTAPRCRARHAGQARPAMVAAAGTRREGDTHASATRLINVH